MRRSTNEENSVATARELILGSWGSEKNNINRDEKIKGKNNHDFLESARFGGPGLIIFAVKKE